MPQNKMSLRRSKATAAIHGLLRPFIVINLPRNDRTSQHTYNIRHRDDKKGQAGNVFIIILLGVFLFGALMYAFTRSANQGSGNLTKQQAKIAAQEILNYARLVEGAVDRVRRNGCSENEISFDNAVVSGYSNPNSPPDNSCHIFDDAGGKITYTDPQNTNWIDPSQSAQIAYGDLGFSGKTWIYFLDPGQVNNQSELIFWITYVPREVCLEINNLVNVNNPSSAPPPFEFGPHVDLFTGSFVNKNGNRLLGATDPILSACAEANSASNFLDGTFFNSIDDTYHFYHVLLAR